MPNAPVAGAQVARAGEGEQSRVVVGGRVAVPVTGMNNEKVKRIINSATMGSAYNIIIVTYCCTRRTECILLIYFGFKIELHRAQRQTRLVLYIIYYVYLFHI